MGTTMTTLDDFPVRTHVWYQPPGDRDEYAGVVTDVLPTGTLRIMTRRWDGDIPTLVRAIVGHYAIEQGRLYRRLDGVDILSEQTEVIDG
jgi:hypothetical protein